MSAKTWPSIGVGGGGESYYSSQQIDDALGRIAIILPTGRGVKLELAAVLGCLFRTFAVPTC